MWAGWSTSSPSPLVSRVSYGYRAGSEATRAARASSKRPARTIGPVGSVRGRPIRGLWDSAEQRAGSERGHRSERTARGGQDARSWARRRVGRAPRDRNRGHVSLQGRGGVGRAGGGISRSVWVDTAHTCFRRRVCGGGRGPGVLHRSRAEGAPVLGGMHLSLSSLQACVSGPRGVLRFWRGDVKPPCAGGEGRAGETRP